MDALSYEPDVARKRVAGMLKAVSGATSVRIILAHQSNIKEPVLSFLKSTDLETSGRDYRMIKMQWKDQTLGAMWLRLPNRGLSNESQIQEMVRIFSLYEYNQKLHDLIDTAQKGLQALTSETSRLIQDHARVLQQTSTSQKRMQALSKGILRTQEEERAKISRDLHDGVGQQLTALKMNLDLLDSSILTALPEEAKSLWKDAKLLTEQTLQDVRELSRLLRPRMLDDLGLFLTLRWYTRRFRELTGISVQFDFNGEDHVVDSDIQTVLFRVTQEALNNVAKHANAKNVTVSVDSSQNPISLQIHDDGIGFSVKDESTRQGSGLAGMRDRVILYGGKFSIQPEPGKGTTIHVEIPHQDRRAEMNLE